MAQQDFKICVDEDSVQTLRDAFTAGAQEIVAATTVLERRIARLEQVLRMVWWLLAGWLVGGAPLITYAAVVS